MVGGPSRAGKSLVTGQAVQTGKATRRVWPLTRVSDLGFLPRQTGFAQVVLQVTVDQGAASLVRAQRIVHATRSIERSKTSCADKKAAKVKE